MQETAPTCDKREGGDLFCLKYNLLLNIMNYFQCLLEALARYFQLQTDMDKNNLILQITKEICIRTASLMQYLTGYRLMLSNRNILPNKGDVAWLHH